MIFRTCKGISNCQSHVPPSSLSLREWSVKNIRHVFVCLFRFLVFALSSASVPTRSGLRTQSAPSSTPDRPPSALQKRSRDLQESPGLAPKKIKGDSDTKSSGTSTQKAEMPSGSGTGKPNGQEVESKRPRQAPRVQNAIYAAHEISSSFDISHAIDFILVGM